jgi:putative ABC transport system ATP-binding protein
MLLADEPTGNLDSRTSLEVLALLQRLNRETGITICLVTHEHDIAACASRVVTFRDGRIQSDVTNEQPLDASSELEKLPPEIAGEKDADDEDPVAAARRRLGGPMPVALYAAMAAAGVSGLLLGRLYASLVLDASTPIPPLAFAFVLEAFAAAWFGYRRFGRALTTDQRARISIFYTLGVAGLIALPTAFGMMPWSDRVLDRLKDLSSGGVAFAIFVVALSFVTVSLARFLIIALMGPLVSVSKRQSRA